MKLLNAIFELFTCDELWRLVERLVMVLMLKMLRCDVGVIPVIVNRMIRPSHILLSIHLIADCLLPR